MGNLSKILKKELKEIVNNLPTYTGDEKLILIYELEILFIPYIRSELKFNELKQALIQRIELSKCSDELSIYVYNELILKKSIDVIIYKFFYELKNELLKQITN